MVDSAIRVDEVSNELVYKMHIVRSPETDNVFVDADVRVSIVPVGNDYWIMCLGCKFYGRIDDDGTVGLYSAGAVSNTFKEITRLVASEFQRLGALRAAREEKS